MHGESEYNVQVHGERVRTLRTRPDSKPRVPPDERFEFFPSCFSFANSFETHISLLLFQF